MSASPLEESITLKGRPGMPTCARCASATIVECSAPPWLALRCPATSLSWERMDAAPCAQVGVEYGHGWIEVGDGIG